MSNGEERKVCLSPEQWERLKRVLEQALQEETPEARLALAENLCRDDSSVLAEAKSLLRHSDEILFGDKTDRLEAGAAEAASLLRGGSVPKERRVGAYRLLEETGRGGMGTVYLAERADGCFEKRVAIKIIKRGTDTDEVLRRFEAERAILARLDHPNIARLVDAGTTEEGLPFFVMEYVDGQSIVQFAQAREMPICDRLELFLKVCAAVEFAHDEKVVHRDLKAGNILVNERGEPKLLDFGIAKLLATEAAEAGITATWQQLFSPACASPEQVRGERATAASDVYALGALLYELLTYQSPHVFADGAPSRAELTRVVCDADPAWPSVVALEPESRRVLRGDLDAIVLRAMAKEPEARYSSAAALARDLQRYLAGEPVQARRHTMAYRVARFTARNRRALFRAGLALVGIAVAALIISVFVVSSHRLQDALKIPPTDRPADNSIAVLPFKDLGGENSAALTDGVQDQILVDLAKVSRLKVISRASVERYDAAEVRNVRELGQRLGVRYVLEGSVQRAGDQARVNVRLIDALRDSQLWSKSYAHELTDLFAMQSQIAQAVAAELKIALLPEEKVGIEQPPTRDLAAYELFLRAKENVNGYLDAPDQDQSLRHAIRLLDEAVARDPEFMLAYCYAARAHSLLFALRLDTTEARKLLARNAVDTALRLQPDSAEAHLALADHYYRCGRQFDLVEQELALARPRLTNSPAFHLLDASIHRRLGRWAESDRSFSRAVELDPNNLSAINLLADNFILERQYTRAIHVYEQAQARGLGSPILKLRIAAVEFARSGDLDRFQAALADAPADLDIGGGETPLRVLVALARRDYAGARRALASSNRAEFQDVDFTFYYPRAWYEGAIARAEGRTDLARDAFFSARVALEEKLKLRPGNARTLAVLAQVDAALGNKELAVAEARTACDTVPLEVDAYDAPIILQGLAQVYAWSGEKEKALDVVEKLVKVPGYLSYGYLRTDPSWDPLRGNPRFEAIVQSLHPALGPKD